MSVRRKQDGRPWALPGRKVSRRVGACHAVTGGKAQENLQPTPPLSARAQVHCAQLEGTTADQCARGRRAQQLWQEVSPCSGSTVWHCWPR